jgi:hypothetical protein
MLAACARRNSRQPGPPRRGASSIRAWASSRRMLVGETRKPSLASPPQIADGPSADSRARAAAPTPAPQPTAAAARAGRAVAATFGAQAPDAKEAASVASPEAHPATSAAGDKLLVALDQPCRASAAQPADPGSRARAATPAARRLSHAGRGGYEPAHRAEPAQQGRGTRRPFRRSSQPSPQGAADTNIGALQGEIPVRPPPSAAGAPSSHRDQSKVIRPCMTVSVGRKNPRLSTSCQRRRRPRSHRLETPPASFPRDRGSACPSRRTRPCLRQRSPIPG